MSGVELWNVVVLVGGGWLVTSCLAMVALLSIHDAERRQPARYALDEPQPDAEPDHRARPTADRVRSSPGTGDSGAQRRDLPPSSGYTRSLAGRSSRQDRLVLLTRTGQFGPATRRRSAASTGEQARRSPGSADAETFDRLYAAGGPQGRKR